MRSSNMGSYKTVIVELAVYIDKDDYIHKGKSVEEIVEKELEIIESDSGIYIERFISYDEVIENDEEK
jgi:hypothetical protein